jgi:acid phosphatase family membrane protein YuiD
MLTDIFANRVLLATLAGWALAQVIKIPLEYLRTRKWNWRIMFSTGGMPSSHTAAVSGACLGIGLWEGFATPLFALSFVLAMVVVYDATGIRRQAGQHAALINAILNERAPGEAAAGQAQLKELLGHTWLEAFGGIFWGVLVVWVFWLVW